MTSLLLAQGAWALDVVFFLLLLGGTALGVKQGFICGIGKIAGLIISIAVAILFCIAFQETLEGWFGLTTALTKTVKNATLARWLAIAISFILLIVIVRLGTWLLGKIGTGIVDNIKPLRYLNMCFGGLLGLFKAVLIIFFLLSLCRLLPSDSLHAFIRSSAVVGKIFDWQWFINATRLSAGSENYILTMIQYKML